MDLNTKIKELEAEAVKIQSKIDLLKEMLGNDIEITIVKPLNSLPGSTINSTLKIPVKSAGELAMESLEKATTAKTMEIKGNTKIITEYINSKKGDYIEEGDEL